MPVDRTPISVSQLAELLGVDPARFLAVERILSQWYIVTEPLGDEMQTTGTCKPLSDNTSKRKPKRK